VFGLKSAELIDRKERWFNLGLSSEKQNPQRKHGIMVSIWNLSLFLISTSPEMLQVTNKLTPFTTEQHCGSQNLKKEIRWDLEDVQSGCYTTAQGWTRSSAMTLCWPQQPS
jgi:hypothetical protein